MSPNNGIFVRLRVVSLSIRPAMARYCPSRSSTSVSARRVRSDGIWKPWMVSPFAKSSDETSGVSLSRMAPLKLVHFRTVKLLK